MGNITKKKSQFQSLYNS